MLKVGFKISRVGTRIFGFKIKYYIWERKLTKKRF